MEKSLMSKPVGIVAQAENHYAISLNFGYEEDPKHYPNQTRSKVSRK